MKKFWNSPITWKQAIMLAVFSLPLTLVTSLWSFDISWGMLVAAIKDTWEDFKDTHFGKGKREA